MSRAVLLLVCLLAGSAAAADLPDAYRVIAQRNMFDPNRQPQRAAPTQLSEAPRPPPADSFTLLGVVVLGGETTAVFGGSRSGLAGTRRVGEATEVGRVTAADTTGVTLQDGQGQVRRLAVGRSLARTTDGTWTETAERPAYAAAGPSPTAAGPAGSTAATAPAGAESEAAAAAPASADEILKRMLERRKKETQP